MNIPFKVLKSLPKPLPGLSLASGNEYLYIQITYNNHIYLFEQFEVNDTYDDYKWVKVDYFEVERNNILVIEL